MAYLDAKAYLEREAESFHNFLHTTIAQFAQSHVARVLFSILSLPFRFYYRFVNPRRACAARVTVVGLSVCLSVCLSVRLSVSQHLTSGASVRLENAVTYSTGDEGQKICGVFPETAPLPRSSTPSVVRPCV